MAEPNASAVAASTGSVAFKKRGSRGNVRKRAVADGSDDDNHADDTSVVRKAKVAKADPLSFSTKKDGKEDLNVKYESNKALTQGVDTSATRMLETETAFDRDARARREQVLHQATAAEVVADDGRYKGMNNYIDYRQGFRREHTIGAEKGTGSHGPLRANVYSRVTARFDYQPDVCKDYKETGFCSYGDSCKFMHDRGDYKSGWELEREWDAEQKRKLEAITKAWDPDDDDAHAEPEGDDDLPFACYICRQNWEDIKSMPVVTKCKHYFCESCALKHNAKTGKCAVCEQATHGIFNEAADIVKKMKRQQKRTAEEG